MDETEQSFRQRVGNHRRMIPPRLGSGVAGRRRTALFQKLNASRTECAQAVNLKKLNWGLLEAAFRLIFVKAVPAMARMTTRASLEAAFRLIFVKAPTNFASSWLSCGGNLGRKIGWRASTYPDCIVQADVGVSLEG